MLLSLLVLSMASLPFMLFLHSAKMLQPSVENCKQVINPSHASAPTLILHISLCMPSSTQISVIHTTGHSSTYFLIQPLQGTWPETDQL
ncbi:uncharacterized protein B0I36DRAFT_332216 [Microdochium trichocladiopsis]|uniref:Secreted protein n=1 Tax=Microdochium trichocladiopsis TaxID=1682393 RepID=A0A9P8XX78_9PEZI|nr:uncharacterized protein B0I36DRAFT_332216 [Microdochium trichocladiopsis]KAH7024914.1 hypothetical protein B0I36DRAFT_332216 [Microdochium trichocladiopsis]